MTAVEPAELPGAREIAEAYTDYTAEHCRRDGCVPMATTSVEAISDLACRRVRNGIARCRFVVGLDRCEARLSLHDGDRGLAWTARDHSTTPWRLRLRCRTD